MKKIGKFFAYLLFFILALILFMPKTSLYYFGELQLKQFGIVISNETLVDSFSSLKAEKLDISVKGVESAYIDSMEFTFLGVYNDVKLEKIKLSSIVEAYLPSKIKLVNIEYSVLNPFNIQADSIGEFGEIDIEFNLLELQLKAELRPSKLMLQKYKRTLRFFKKSKKGEYSYAKSI